MAELLANLAATPATKPLADLFQGVPSTAGITVGPSEGLKTHAQKVKDSLQVQRKALDTLHRVEKAQAARQAKIDFLQGKIDQITEQFVKAQEELALGRTDSDEAQEAHRQLLDELDELVDCGLDEDRDMQEIKSQCDPVKDGPVVIAFMPCLRLKSGRLTSKPSLNKRTTTRDLTNQRAQSCKVKARKLPAVYWQGLQGPLRPLRQPLGPDSLRQLPWKLCKSLQEPWPRSPTHAPGLRLQPSRCHMEPHAGDRASLVHEDCTS